MAEVISLLSSPPGSPIRNASKAAPRLSAQAALYDFDDFDSTGDIEFPIEQAAKRKKPSPAHQPSTTRSNTRKPLIAGLELSSEPDLPSAVSESLPVPNTRPVNVELDLSSDHDCPPSSAPVKASRLSGITGLGDVDEIEFSSSAPVPTRNKGKDSKATRIVHVLSSDSITAENDELDAPQLLPSITSFSSRTMKVLNSINNQNACKNASRQSQSAKVTAAKTSKHKSTQRASVFDDILVSSPPQSKTTNAVRSDAAAKEEQRAAAKAAREADKEAEKQRKKDAKLERDREKQKAKDMAEVNRSKTNKKETSKEMMLQMGESIKGTSIGNQVEEYMRQHEVGFSYATEEISLSHSDGNAYPGKLLEWKRRVDATYDEHDGQWVPLTTSRIEPTDHVAILMNGHDFASIAIGPDNDNADLTPDLETMRNNLDRHVARLRHRHKEARLIYLVQGLHAWVKRNENSKQRDYVAAVRAQMADEEANNRPTSSQSRKRKQAKSSPRLLAVTADVVEDLQLYLQINHQPLVIHHTTSEATTASQILSFTQSLSSRPYRVAELEHNLKSSSFYMGAGAHRTGEDAQETFCRMLEAQQRVTPSIAQSIASQWCSPRELVTAFRNSDNLMLENVRKSTNKDGGYSDKRIGPVISKRMYKVFLGRNPEATDGMS